MPQVKIPEQVKGIMATAGRQLRYVEDPFDKKQTVPGPLLPNTIYEAGKKGTKTKYVYTTDSLGRIKTAHARPLRRTAIPRGKHNSKTPDKRPGDQAGHILADQFDGAGDLRNLISQSEKANHDEFGRIEKDWRERLDRGEKFDVDIEIIYGDEGLRPTGFKITEFLADGTIRAHQIISNNEPPLHKSGSSKTAKSSKPARS